MAGLLYFLPSETDTKEALGGIAKGCQVESGRANSGPGGSPGAVVFLSFPTSPREGRPLVGYYPKKQTWHSAGSPGVFVGYETDNPPNPEDLARPEMIDGHFVRLADGKDWLVPTARIFPQGSRLPKALILGPGGELISESLPRYASISRQADRVWAEFERSIDGNDPAESEKPLTVQDQFDIAIEALSINYRLSKWEASALRLLTTDNVVKIIQALIDVPTLIEVAKAHTEALKKKDLASILDGSNSSDGKPDGSRNTSQPTQTLTGSVKGT